MLLSQQKVLSMKQNIQQNQTLDNHQPEFNTSSFPQSNHTNTFCNLSNILGSMFSPTRKSTQDQKLNSQSIMSTTNSSNSWKDYHLGNIVEVKMMRSEKKKIDISNMLESIRKDRILEKSLVIKKNKNSLCLCEKPCKWGRKWVAWSLQSQDKLLYQSLKQAPMRTNMLAQIQKDMKRTQPLDPSFQSFINRKMLQQVLQTYSKYDKQLEYIQGMNMITSVILYHVHDAQQTFWILVDIMEKKQFREIYVNNFQKLSNHTLAINQMINNYFPMLALHFKRLQIQFELISTGWLLSMFCSVVPLKQAHIVVNKFIQNGWTALYTIIGGYLWYQQNKLLKKHDPSDVLSYFSPSLREDDIDWENVFCLSDQLYSKICPS